MNKLYSISGDAGSYVIRYYPCEEMKGNFSLPTPEEVIKWENIDETLAEKLFKERYISEFQYNDILNCQPFEKTWFYAVGEEEWAKFSFLTEDEDDLVGHYPTIIDECKDTICWVIYLFVWLISICLLGQQLYECFFG